MKLKIVKHAPGIITYESDKGIQLNASPDDLLKKNVLLMFDSKDRAQIREMAQGYISHQHEYDIFWLAGLFALYLTITIGNAPLALNSIHILGTVQPGGILIFPLSFVVLDSVNEIFQYRYARKLTFTTSSMMLFLAAALFISLHVIQFPPEFQQYLSRLPMFFLTNALCLPVADQTNNLVFRAMRYRLAICPLWLRCIVSTTTGQLTYTIIWIGLFFGTSINTELLTRIIDNYGFKMIYAACLIPVTYLIVAIYRSRKPHYQTATSL